MDRIHVVDKRLHRLVDTLDGTVDRQLTVVFQKILPETVHFLLGRPGLQYGRRAPVQHIDEDIVSQFQLLKFREKIIYERFLLVIEIQGHDSVSNLRQFLLVCLPDIRRHVEVEGGYGLAAVHLVLHRLHRDAGKGGGRLDPLRGTHRRMAFLETVHKEHVRRMLDAREGLRRIEVLIVDVDEVGLHGGGHLGGKEAFVHEGLAGLGGELHHHPGRRVRVHVGVLARDLVRLGLQDLPEDLHGIRLSGDVPLVPVPDVLLGHILARGTHESRLHGLVYLIHPDGVRVPVPADRLDLVDHSEGDLPRKVLVDALLGRFHRLHNSVVDMVVIESHDTSVALLDV